MDGPPRPSAAVSARLTFVGHATFLIESGGETIVTDPIFGDRVGRFFTKRANPCPIDVAGIRGVTGILISHGHHDHLDYPSLRQLGKARPIVAPWGIATPLRMHGYAQIQTLRPWEETSLGLWHITAVPSRHFGGRLPLVFTTGFQGYVLDGPRCIYFAGDSGLDEAMFLEIGRRFRIDVAVLPIAGALFPRFRRNHMDAPQALRAFQLLQAGRMVPMHFETFHASLGHPDTARRQLIEEAERLDLTSRVSILSPGETLELSAPAGLMSGDP